MITLLTIFSYLMICFLCRNALGQDKDWYQHPRWQRIFLIWLVPIAYFFVEILDGFNGR